jgi:NAD(P)-dependent dehydrogenase (short-subunit alcohol dehydrogenase family)
MGANAEEQAVVVTGASSGIGAAIACHLAEQGHRVITVQRRAPDFLGQRGAGSVEFMEADLTNAQDLSDLSEVLSQRFEVGYLVNNAGVNRPGSIYAVTDADLDAVWQLNVKAPIALIQAVLPGMRERRFGRIVNISSRAILGKTERIAYVSSKGGLAAMTRSLCLEVAGDGITVNTVAPGPVGTALFDNGHPLGSEKRAKVIASVPVKRIGTPLDVARSVAFFLSPDSGFITGQTLFVCGGVSVSGSGGV